MSSPFAPLLSRLLQKRFASPDGLEGLGALLQPVMQVAPMPDDLALLAQERLFTFANSTAGVAAQYGFLTLRNNSVNQLCVVEKLVMSVASAASCVVAFQSSPTTGNSGISRDQRNVQGSRVLVGVATDAAALPGGPYTWLEQLTAATAREISVPLLIMPPQSVLTVVCSVVNVAANFAIAWRERTMEDSETAQL